MNEKYQLLYGDMVADISRCLELELPEKENVENCFFIAKNYWDQLQGIVLSRGFGSDEDEIAFYRDVKPRFTSWIEYFSLLAEGLQFVPPWVPFPETLTGKIEESAWRRTWQDTVNEYWITEQQRGERFYKKNREFIEYCQSGSLQCDPAYFLARNNVGAELILRRTHNRDTELFTVHEEILSTWYAYQRYHEYIQKKVNVPVGS